MLSQAIHRMAWKYTEPKWRDNEDTTNSHCRLFLLRTVFNGRSIKYRLLKEKSQLGVKRQHIVFEQHLRSVN